MAVMIDAMILIQAIGVENGLITRDSSPRVWDQARGSHSLVQESEQVTMAAIRWYEVLRGLRPEHVPAFNVYRGRVRIMNPPPPDPEQLNLYETVNPDAERQRRRSAGESTEGE